MRTQKNGTIAYDCACGGSFRAKASFASMTQLFDALRVFQAVHSALECHETTAAKAAYARRKQERQAVSP